VNQLKGRQPWLNHHSTCRWTGVVEKRDGRWVIVQQHFSFASDRVSTEPNAAAGRTVFFTSSREGRDDVFWIEARVVASLRPSAKPPAKR